MKKKILCMTMSMILVLSMMVGCGGTKNENEKQEEKTEKTETEEKENFEGTTVETNYFSVVYSDDWECDPENGIRNVSDGSGVTVSAPDPESDGSKVRVSIMVTQNIAPKISQYLYETGMNAEDAVKGTKDYPVRKIGGVDCWVAETNGYGPDYYGYVPDKNAFIRITVDDNNQWELVDPLLDSIKLNIPDWNGEVIPWYWEGTPYSVSEHSTTVGSYTVNSKQIPLDVIGPCYEIFDARVQVVGNEYYIYDNYKLKKYTREGDSLKYSSEIELPYEAEDISVAADGTVYIADSGRDFTKIQDGTETVISEATDHVALNPACTWGVSYFTKPDVAKINVADGAITNYTLTGLFGVTKVFVTENYIVLSGSRDDEDRTACLMVYDHDFNELMSLDKTTTTTNHYGSVSAVTETANGLMVFDGNMRDVYFLDKNLSLIGAVSMTDLMGTHYPWPCQALTLEDGSVIAICTDDRADKSCDEAIVYQLTGF